MPDKPSLANGWRTLPRAVARSVGGTLRVVASTHPRLFLALIAMSVLGGVLPAAIAWVGKQIVDGVIGAWLSGLAEHREWVLVWVAVELGLVIVQRALKRGTTLSSALLRRRLGQAFNVRILERALELPLSAYEDPKTHDRMTRARRGASYRPLNLVMKTLGLARQAIALVAYGAMLWQLAPWALILVIAAAVPGFIVSTRTSRSEFRLFSWRAPETRQQNYLESVIARAEPAKEVKLFGLGPMLLARYRGIFESHYREDRRRAIRQAALAYSVGLLGTFVFYGAYAWIVWRAARGEISFGDMTMYLLIFRSAQSAIRTMLEDVRFAYEDVLYVDEMFGFLARSPSEPPPPTAPVGLREGPNPDDGFRLENVTFTYPGADAPTLDGLDLHVPPRHKLALVGVNGAGKTTLIKVLTGLYSPDRGRVTLDGLALDAWNQEALRRRIGVIFQDFVQYQFLVGENIGVGDVDAIDDEARWREAAKLGLAHEMIEELPDGYHTQLGKWFENGHELSGGEWQKIALARGYR